MGLEYSQWLFHLLDSYLSLADSYEQIAYFSLLTKAEQRCQYQC